MTDLLRNEEILQRVMEERNVLHTVKRSKEMPSKIRYCRKGRWKMGRRGRRRIQIVHDFKENRGYRKMKGEVLDRTLW